MRAFVVGAFYFFFFIVPISLCGEIHLELNPCSMTTKKMNLLLYSIQHIDQAVSNALQDAAELLSCPLETKTGFTVKIQNGGIIETHTDMKKFYQEGFHLVIFISFDPVLGCHIWRLYDTARVKMLLNGVIEIKAGHVNARALASAWWKGLVGTEALFNTSLAFCTEAGKGHSSRNLEIVPFGGTFQHRTTIVKQRKILMPRWYPDGSSLIFYSEITPLNIRLVSLDIVTGKKQIAVNSKGSSFAPAYCPNATSLVYCHSHDGQSRLCRYTANGLDRIMFDDHDAQIYLSPVLSNNGDIIFCSDAVEKTPQIFYYQASKKQVKQMTFGITAQCPDYSQARDLIIFVRPIKGVSQLFCLSPQTGQAEQLTFDSGSKEECRWSPNGQYIVYVHSQKNTRRIACFNVDTREAFFITSETERSSYPAWSFM